VRSSRARGVPSWDGAIAQASTSLGTVFFLKRRRPGPDPLVRIKLATFIVGAVLGLVGMRFNNSLLVTVAIGVVLVGFLLRFSPKARSDADHNDPPP